MDRNPIQVQDVYMKTRSELEQIAAQLTGSTVKNVRSEGGIWTNPVNGETRKLDSITFNMVNGQVVTMSTVTGKSFIAGRKRKA